MATKKRANVISANVLAKAVDTAVSLASKRLDAKLENGTLALNWEIIGRQISGLKDMNQAMTIASEITKNGSTKNESRNYHGRNLVSKASDASARKPNNKVRIIERVLSAHWCFVKIYSISICYIMLAYSFGKIGERPQI